MEQECGCQEEYIENSYKYFKSPQGIILPSTWIMSMYRFSCGSAGQESTCNVGDLGSIPGS